MRFSVLAIAAIANSVFADEMSHSKPCSSSSASSMTAAATTTTPCTKDQTSSSATSTTSCTKSHTASTNYTPAVPSSSASVKVYTSTSTPCTTGAAAATTSKVHHHHHHTTSTLCTTLATTKKPCHGHGCHATTHVPVKPSAGNHTAGGQHPRPTTHQPMVVTGAAADVVAPAAAVLAGVAAFFVTL